MRCAWNELIRILPTSIRSDVDRLGQETLQELRLRLSSPPELVTETGNIHLTQATSREDLLYCINTASRYSPWAAATTAQGYLTAPGGHRIGMCGEAVIRNGKMEGIRNVTSLCIRVARDFPDIAGKLGKLPGSLLILGPPGSGKTTLLRDLIRQRSAIAREHVAVVDERGELFPPGGIFQGGALADVMTGCGKAQGIDTVLRTMGPSCIAVDEITAEEDCQALLKAGWCGVTLVATAHASSKKDLYTRPVYRPLVDTGLFETLIILRRDKTWTMERMEL